MPARVEISQPQIEQATNTFGTMFQRAYESIGPALPGIVIRGIQNVGNMTLNTLDAVVTAAAKTLESPAHYVINHPRSAAVLAGANALGVFGLAACVPSPIEPPLPAEVQPANTPSAAEKLATTIAQGTPPAGRASIPFTGGAIPTSEPATIPTQSPVEKAIEQGRIEIKSPQEWQNYFTLVSPSEAREMLARAREKGEFKFLAPQFDLSKVTKDFAIENRTLSSSTYKVVHLVMRGIKPGATFYSNQDGQGSGNAPSSGLTRFISIGIDNGEIRQNMSTIAGPDYKTLPVGAADWPLSPVFGVKGATASLKIGDPLFTLPTEEIIDQGISASAGGGTWRERLGDWQVHYFIKKGDDFSLAKLEDVLRHPQTGKIAMLDRTALSGAK